MSKPKAKYRKNDVILLETKNRAAIIENKTFVEGKGYLYTLKTMGDENYKRYYESRINEQCSKLKNSKAVKVLYTVKKK